MRFIFTLFFLGIVSTHISGQRLGTEDFNYATGSLTDLNGGVNVSGGAWTNSSGNAKPLQVTADDLFYTNYYTNPFPGSGRLLSDTISASGEDAYMSFVPQNSNTLYCSVLLDIYSTVNVVPHDSATGDYFIAFLPSGNTFSYAGRLYIRQGAGDNTFNLGIAAQSAANTPVAWLSSDFTINVTHLVTIAYQFVPGSGNDVAKLWVDYPFSTTEPVPQAFSSYSGGSENNNEGRLAIRQNYSPESNGGTPKASIDAIKISTSWSDVSLPVTLVYFMASLQNGQPVLTWKTTNELNLAEYVIESSSDARNFREISAVRAKNSSSENVYVFTDVSPVQGQIWYRLKIINTDGSYFYSSLQGVSAKNILHLELRGNPVYSSLVIDHSIADDNAHMLIINLAGTIVRTVHVQPGNSETKLDVSSIAAGTYYILYKTAVVQTGMQFIKQ